MAQTNAITLKQLRALMAVYERGSITSAADTLNLTVPAVSTQLKTLEANVGSELVIRTHDAMGGDVKGRLTLQGKEVLATAYQIEAALAHCDKAVASIKAGKSGYVSLGVVSTGKYFAPRIVAIAKQLMPDIRVDLTISNRQGIIAGLQDHSIDLAIMGRPPRYPSVDSVALSQHPHFLIAPPDHPLVNARNISPERLLAETFIMREIGSGTRILTERFLDRLGDGRTYDSIEFNTNETIKQAVIAGLGIALISGHTVRDGLTAGRIATIKMPGLPIMRRWYLVRVVNTPSTPAIEKIQEFLVQNEKKYLPELPQGLMV